VWKNQMFGRIAVVVFSLKEIVFAERVDAIARPHVRMLAFDLVASASANSEGRWPRCRSAETARMISWP
jgi:hypothetical protein